MTVFFSTLGQMGFLLLLLGIGFLLIRLRVLPENCPQILSKLENNVFVPALVLSTFINHFTLKNLTYAWQYVLCASVAVLASMAFAIVVSRFYKKEDLFTRDVITYGLAFSNFGFMGNAVVSALFPEIFADYLLYVIPFWTMIYVWGVPSLLIPKSEAKGSSLSGLKNLINPMFIALILGMAIGLTGIPVPAFIDTAASSLGNCMSPIAMLLTGMTVAKIDLKKAFTNRTIHSVSLIRLLLMPILVMIVLYFIPLPYGVSLCTVCAMAMPLGLSPTVVPAAYGKDTSVASGMALISHLLSCITIPLVFLIFGYFFS
ncbi:MAG: AEC family transporter [Clostridia bacterium]|nr:AEC family transporter [Clostridia bacterium]